MSEDQPRTPPAEGEAAEGAAPQIERGAYEVLRERLANEANRLAEAAEALNRTRLDLFGRTELQLLGTERIRTENNCVPRDVVQVGGHLLFGYNVHIGLRTETKISDVFALHAFREVEGRFEFEEVKEGPARAFLDDPQFVKEFGELYHYYKDTRLLQLRSTEGGKLLAVFQTGRSLADIKVFRWGIERDGSARYIDNRGERDHVYPPSHDFEWTQTTREDHVAGRHPHVSILNQIFVETVGGDLTVKLENNTDAGEGIYAEPVEDERQSLDDAEIHYARVGALILLKILPYREKTFRYLLYNGLTREVVRMDPIGQACVSLPEDHGIIFPGGYHLRTGETKLFDGDHSNLEYQRAIRAPNGEDVMYVFHAREEGRSVLLPYNLIRKEVRTPVTCNGFSRFDDGRVVIFRSQTDEPTRVHPMQTWQTPFCSDEYHASIERVDSPLAAIGNADLVRGISDCLSLARSATDLAPSRQVYEDLIANAVRVKDAYYWLGRPEGQGLLEAVERVHQTAETVIDEFEKVEAIRRSADEKLKAAARELQDVLRETRPEEWTSVPRFVDALAELRRRRGHLITLRELRFVDRVALDALEKRVVEAFDRVSDRAVQFLTGGEALAPYHEEITGLEAKAGEAKTAHELTPITGELERLTGNIDVLADVIAGLDIPDATLRTSILEGISEVVAALNRARAVVEGRRREMRSKESVAEFGVEFRLLGQSVTSALSMADTPEKCDDALSRLMLQVEELEARFGEFDEFAAQLATKREEVYEAVSSKKQTLLDERQRRADTVAEAAERILSNVARRAQALGTDDELNAYFAGDPMILKLRDLTERLRTLGAASRAEEIEARVATARKEAARGMRDRADLYEEGDLIRLGRHRFGVNTRAPELTLVPRGEGMALHLTGTDFYEPFEDEAFTATREYWSQERVSETPEVYRAEYLAATILADAEEGRNGLSLEALHAAAREEGKLGVRVREIAAERYDEGYERGVHDVDAAKILEKLLALHQTADLLRFDPKARAFAAMFLYFATDAKAREAWQRRARSLARLRSSFAHSPAIAALCEELGRAIDDFLTERGIDVEDELARRAGAYLFEELSRDPVHLVASGEAVRLRDAFLERLGADGAGRDLEHDIEALEDDPKSLWELTTAWLTAFLDAADKEENAALAALRPELEEAAALLLTARLGREVSSTHPAAEVTGLLGQHPRTSGGKLALRLDEFLARLGRFRRVRVPGFRAYQDARHRALERERRRLRLDEFQPRVMSAFVRNRLIDEVYLPLIGDNLAKQIGAAGEGKRTDLMGMLLLISPPGYGKTTLMEYIANRLGLVFVKVNGPSLGHGVTTLDPDEAGSATARQEVEKINFALEMGTNVLLYLDDIQHTNPELLQKFISLCDAQRRIEGVWRGRTRTYDLKGKRFCVCMAGNPYTESGEKFRIPDMLANRADTWNLGDVLEGKDELFLLSYVENALTSNPVLSPLTTRPREDLFQLVRMAEGKGGSPEQLQHSYSAPELEEILAVLKKLVRCRDVLAKVNAQYIASAAQKDAYRTEPPFQLQGSYRNMNKLAERVVAVMNDAELEALIDDHYQGESQTLTGGAEQNLLKLAELRGRMTPEQKQRWDEIKRRFARVQSLAGADEDDPVTRVTGQLGLMSEQLATIAGRITEAAEKAPAAPVVGAPPPAAVAAAADGAAIAEQLAPILEKLQQTLATAAARDSSGAAEAIASRLDGLARSLAGIGEAIAEAAAKAPAAPSVAPQVQELKAAVEKMARTPQRARREVVQTLPGGVQDLLNEMVRQIQDALMPGVRVLARRVEGSDDATDRRLRDQLARTLKDLDQLRDLAEALRRLDTTGLQGR